MFAGAAREAVFSNPEVIRRVNADFIPVALKAGLVNNPSDDEEGRLYREIGRSKVAPQGICAANSAGKVLAWALMFEDDKSVLAFLNHSLKRYAKFPDAKQLVSAERYMKFAGAKLDDVEDNGKCVAIADSHPKGKDCPAKPRLRKGTIVARLYGRALDADGKPIADTVRQEHYVEERFEVPVRMQETLAKALADAGKDRVRFNDELAHLLVSHAYLGQLDVNPVGNVPGGKGALKQCEFWAQKVGTGEKGIARIRLEGKSEAAGASHDNEGGDGRRWQHEVTLEWEGLVEMQGDRMARLLLVARGSEKLKWGNKLQDFKGQADVTHLPAGHPIDLACGVRYGVIGIPVPVEEAGDVEPAGQAPPVSAEQVPDEARRQLVEAFGPLFLVFRDKVQKELQVSDEQREKLGRRLAETVSDAMKFFGKVDRLKPEEREKEVEPYRRKAQESLAAFLKDTLKPDQGKRLRQLELQQQGLFALGNPEVADELKLREEQRKQFQAIVQELQKKAEPLIKEAQSGGKPEEIGPKIHKLRKEHESKIGDVLTDAQKKRWREMLGKQFDLTD